MELNEADLFKVQEELYPIRAKWYHFGLALKVPPHELDAIQVREQHDFLVALCDVIKYWLRNGIDPKPSWRVVISALKSRSLGSARLGKDLEVKYCHQPETQLQLPDSGDIHVAETRKRMNQLHFKMEDLVHTTGETLKQNNVDVSRVRTTVTFLPNSKRHEYSHFLIEKRSEIASATSIDELFCCLNMYWDYLNFGLLQYIIDRYGDKETKQMMQEFVAEVEEFRKNTTLDVFWKCNGHVEEIPTDLKEMVIKDDQLSPDSTLEDVENVRRELAREYSLHEFAMMLVKVVKGSVILTFLVFPSVVPQLQTSNDKFFKEHHITSVTVDGILACSYIEGQPKRPNMYKLRAAFDGILVYEEISQSPRAKHGTEELEQRERLMQPRESKRPTTATALRPEKYLLLPSSRPVSTYSHKTERGFSILSEPMPDPKVEGRKTERGFSILSATSGYGSQDAADEDLACGSQKESTMPVLEDCLKKEINLLGTENGCITILLELHRKPRIDCDGEEGKIFYTIDPKNITALEADTDSNVRVGYPDMHNPNQHFRQIKPERDPKVGTVGRLMSDAEMFLALEVEASTLDNAELVTCHELPPGSLCDDGMQQPTGTKILLSALTIHRKEVSGYTKMALHFSINRDEQQFWYFVVPASDGTRTVSIERTIAGFSEISKFAKWQSVMPVAT